jgi:hypothetical protein
MITASTITTTITPDHTPALKMPSIAEQLAKVVVNNAISASGKYFVIFIVVLFFIGQQQFLKMVLSVYLPLILSSSISKIKVL